MKINEKYYGTERLREIYYGLKAKKPMRAWFKLIGGILAIIILSFGALGYGAYLKDIGNTHYYKRALVQLAHLDFSFIKNFASGNMSDLDKIDIDIKFKHLLRLKYLREQAMENGMITADHKNESFPAKLTYNGVSHNVKIALTGMMTIHLENDTKWSFEVKVKGDDTINGMKRMGMLLPATRGYITDWVGMELMKERGLMGLRVDFVDVAINGQPKGIFYMEERFDKHLIENNRLRESIIFKLQDDLDPYQESKLLADPGAREQLFLLKRMWQDVLAGNMELGQFLDLRKMAQAFAITDLMNNRHALYRFNLRFYFNPVTGLTEPIVREWGSMHKNDPKHWSIILEEPRLPGTQRAKLDRDPLLKRIYDNIDFKKYYIQEAMVLSQPEFLDNFLEKNEEKLNELLSKVYVDWPFYELPTHYLYENQAYIQEALQLKVDDVIAYFVDQQDSKLTLQIRNTQDLPVEVKHMSWQDSIIFLPLKPVILDGGHTVQMDEVQSFEFGIPSNLKWFDKTPEDLKITYHLLGDESSIRTNSVYTKTLEGRFPQKQKAIVHVSNYNSFPFIQKVPQRNVLIIPEGEWTLDKDLIIPEGYRLELKAGDNLDMTRNSRIISYSPVFFQGTEQDSIHIYSSDESSEGIAVLGTEERSSIEYSSFENLSSPSGNEEKISGAVVFYQSPVDFRSVSFTGNVKGENCLSIIRSDFSIDKARFKDISIDAFECDFSTGNVTNTSFVDVGSNAMVITSSDINLSHIFMNRIGQEALSANEGSNINARWVEVSNSEIALISKDRSKLNISDCKISGSRIGVTAFEKRTEFGPAYVAAERLKIFETDLPYLIETNSDFHLEGEQITPNHENVKKLLYGENDVKAAKI
jgi:hypothetical protein